MQTSVKKRTLISDLCKELDSYMLKDQVDKIYQAYIVAATAHDGQYRHSGEAYVFHPINVAMILAELKLDCYCITAALLHDCIEDTSLTQDDIVRDFGEEVAHIVQGVSKLTGLEFHSNLDKQAQNFRKLFLAMSTDMRVMMIKLADRLHNMRTLKSIDREKQLRIAKETSEIHSPIARRLGLNGIKIELDDLCFEILYPFRHKVLMYQIKKQYGNCQKTIKHIQQEIENRFQQEGLKQIEITGRRKQPVSVYNKMKVKQLKFSQVLDMYAFRVIVNDVSQCYQALGIVHNLYKPLPGKFKDYVALPKSNGYQSLHTVLFGPNKTSIEVQIRSQDMHFISEYGIAAHWHYKSEGSNPKDLARNWLGSLLEIQQNSGTSLEFLEETKTDLFASEIFVFTPNGEIIQLPYKSTVLDFAYAIHTNIGNRTLKAKVDQLNTPISAELKSGQTIEIITDKKAKPHPSWLKMTMTAKAKSSIKAKLKEESTDELMQLGEYLLNNALDYRSDDAVITKKKWQSCLLDLKCDSKSDLYIKIGLSEILVSVVLNKLVSGDKACLIKSINIKQIQGKVISVAHCCYPIPGDRVAGILTMTKGLVIHRFDCGNLVHAKQKNEQWLEINWQADKNEEFEVLIKVQTENRRGMLASIANTIAKIGINIEHLEVDEKDHSMKALNLVIVLPDIAKLDEVLYAISSLEFVHSVKRG